MQMQVLLKGLVPILSLHLCVNASIAGVIVTGSKGPVVNNGLVNVAAYDNVIFRVTAYNTINADDTVSTVFPSGTNSISSIQGTFTAIGGTMFFSDYKDLGAGLESGHQSQNTARVGVESAADLNSFRSFVNLELTAGTPTPSSGVVENLTSYSYAWLTTGNNLNPNTATSTRTRLDTVDRNTGPFDQTLLARIFVTPGTTVSFSGHVNTAAGLNTPISFSFTSVPEPSTLVLAFIGLAGVVASGASATSRRRRKKGTTNQEVLSC